MGKDSKLGPGAPLGIRELRSRQDRVRRSIGEQLRDLRHESGASQTKLALVSGLDQAHVSRIERARATSSIDSIVTLAAVLGADVSVRLFPTGTRRIRDNIQAVMIEALLRRLGRRWVATLELPVPAARGVIDLAIRERATGFGVACEGHSELRSIDLVLRRLQEKELALAGVDGFGPRTSRLLLLRSTARTRQLVRLHAATFEAAFPGRVQEAFGAIRGVAAIDLAAPWPGPTLLWARVEGGRAEILESPPRGIRVGR